MKKSLVALAALAATGAFAQVTIDGYFDRSYAVTNNTINTKDSKAIGSNAGTTTIGIKVVENLSSDLAVGLSVNTDWADLASANQDNNTNGNTVQAGGFANSQSFAHLTSKSMGVLRLGSPNNFTLTNATAVAAPAFSTGIGSSYSTNFSIANGLGTGTQGAAGVVNRSASIDSQYSVSNAGQRAIRINNTIQYSSPSFSGFSVHLGKSLKNDQAAVGSATTTADTVGVDEYALRYTNGPIDAMYTTIKYSTGPGTYANGITTNFANSTNTQNLLGATYTVNPALKLHAGFGSYTSTADTYKGKSTQYGVTYTMGQIDLLAQMVKVDDSSTATGSGTNNTASMDRKLTGLGLNYNLSKTARLYVRYDSINYNSNGTTRYDGSDQKRTAFGFSKSF